MDNKTGKTDGLPPHYPQEGQCTGPQNALSESSPALVLYIGDHTAHALLINVQNE